MEVTITKYLREDRGGLGLAAIHLRVCWLGQKVRFSAREKIRPSLWDAQHQIIIKSPDKAIEKESKAVSRRLGIYTTQLEKFFEVRTIAPTVAEVQAEIERIRREELGYIRKVRLVPDPPPEAPAYPSLKDFLTGYAKTLPGGLTGSTRHHIEAIMTHLDAFREGLDWKDLRINTLNQLKNYFSEELVLADNTIVAYFGSFKGALKYARICQYPVPDDYTLISNTRADVIRPVLTRQHIEILQSLTFPDDPETEQTRWLFLMACFTGLRRSDLHQARMANVRTIEGHPCLVVIQQKTGKSLAIPLIPRAFSLLQQRPDGLPVPDIRTYNINIRELAKKAEFTEQQVVASVYKGKILSETMPLHDLMSSHTARRTFAVIMTEGGLNTRVLQELMGHVDISSTQKYVRLSSQAIVTQAVSAWEKIW